MSKGLMTRVFAMKKASEFSLESLDSPPSDLFLYSKKGFEKISDAASFQIDESQFADPFPDSDQEDAAIIKLLLMAINPAHQVTATGGVLTWTAMACCFDSFDGTCTFATVPGHVKGPQKKNPIKTVIVNPEMTKMLALIGAVGQDKIGQNGSGKLNLCSRQVGNQTWNEKTGKMGEMETVIVPERKAGLYVTKQCPEMAVIMAGRPNNIGYCIQNDAGKIALLITNSTELGIVAVVTDDSALYKANKKAS